MCVCAYVHVYRYFPDTFVVGKSNEKTVIITRLYKEVSESTESLERSNHDIQTESEKWMTYDEVS